MQIIKLTETAKTQKTSNSRLITAIKPSIKTENRVNVFVDDKFDFSLDIAQVIDLHIKVGRALTEDELKKCRHASEFGKLYFATLEYALSRPHSEKEVRDHLIKRRRNREMLNRQAVINREKSKLEREKYKLRTRELPLYTDDDINEVISRLKLKGYIDDEKFVMFYLENRFVKKGISEKRMRQELAKKGIENRLIDSAFKNHPRDQREEISKIIKRKSRHYEPEKLIAYLVRQGFDYQQSKDAVREMGSQNLE